MPAFFRLPLLGFGSTVDGINGKPVNDDRAVENLVQGLLDHPPGDVRFWQAGPHPRKRWDKATGSWALDQLREAVQVWYVGRDAMQRLQRFMSDLDIEKLERVSDYETPRSGMVVGARSPGAIGLGPFSEGGGYDCDRQPRDDAKQRCRRFGQAILAEMRATRVPRADDRRIDCRDLRDLSRVIGLWTTQRGVRTEIELRYVDWLAQLP